MGICKSNLSKNGEVTIPQVMWCGATTGAIVSVVVTPIEGIKGRYQKKKECILNLIQTKQIASSVRIAKGNKT